MDVVEGLQVSEWEMKFMDFVSNDGELKDNVSGDAFVSVVAAAAEVHD